MYQQNKDLTETETNDTWYESSLILTFYNKKNVNLCKFIVHCPELMFFQTSRIPNF